MEEEPEHSVCCWQTCHSLVAMASSFPLQCCSQKAACPGLLACPEVTVTILHVETGAALSDPCGSLPAWDMSNMTLRHPRMTTSSYSNWPVTLTYGGTKRAHWSSITADEETAVTGRRTARKAAGCESSTHAALQSTHLSRALEVKALLNSSLNFLHLAQNNLNAVPQIKQGQQIPTVWQFYSYSLIFISRNTQTLTLAELLNYHNS